MDLALDLRAAQEIFEEEYAELRRRAASALYSRIAARPHDREELIQNTLCHVWNAWLSICRRGAFHGMKPNHRLLRLVYWQAKLRRTFGHTYRNRFDPADGSHGCLPIEEVMRRLAQGAAVFALREGQSAAERLGVADGPEIGYRQTR